MARRPGTRRPGGRRGRRAAEQAESLAVGLGLLRIGWGTVQMLMPRLIDRYLVRAGGPAATPAWRMKGVRDVMLGIGVAAAASRAELTTWTRIGALVDAGDTIATGLDRGRVLRPAISVLGVTGGLATLAAAAAVGEALARGR